MKLLLVSINFSLVIGKVIQEIRLKVINTIVCTLTLPIGNYTMVQQAIYGHTH